MLKESGDKHFPIWLVGDSNTKNWADQLGTPLDPRHPAIHNIWTPILDVIQDKVYRDSHLRIDASKLYIRNAIECATDKPDRREKDWSEKNQNKIKELNVLLRKYQPAFLFSFGSFSYEFCRRAMGEIPHHPFQYWTTKRLGEGFREKIFNFQINQTNIIPLLHATIARRYFIISHNYYCGYENANYFNYVGNNIAEIMLAHQQELKIWI